MPTFPCFVEFWMLFSNAFVYRLTAPFTLDGGGLLERLESASFVPCSGIRPSSFGWVSPTGIADSPLLHEVAGCFLLCARREDKVIPPSALNEAVAERIELIEKTEGRHLNAKERASLKEDSLAQLLPRALARAKQIYGYISPADDLLIVGTGSATEADKFLDCLRDTLGSIPCSTPRIKSKLPNIYTDWLLNRKLPDHFTLGNQCDLVDLEDGASVTCRRQDLDTREIRSHLEAGKICTRIGLRWHGDLSLAVDKDLSLKQIKWESIDDAADREDDPIARLDAEFVTLTLEFSRFLPALFSALGGEQRD